jgi:hypothetical protein
MVKKQIKQGMAIMIFCSLVLSGCGKTLEQKTTFNKVKDVVVSEDTQQTFEEMMNTINEILTKYGGNQTCQIGNAQVSVTFPDEWFASKHDSDAEYNRIYADSAEATPNYKFEVEQQDRLYDKNFKDQSKKLIKQMENMTDMEVGKSFIKKMEKVYSYHLKKEEYPKWTKVSFDKKTIHEQVYVVAKGKLKATSKRKREKGSYWYITIKNGTLLTFKFTTQHPNIDESVVSVFEDIMDTVEYE